MKKLTALCLCLALLCPWALAAEEEQNLWTRTEGDGSYVTIRVPAPEGVGMSWAEYRYLSVRYADTKEPVPLSSDYLRGYLFATVPAEQAGRPLEVFEGEKHRFPDCITVWEGTEYYEEYYGGGDLCIRGVVQGDQAGNLNAGQGLTRAEAFAFLCRLLSLEPAGDPGFADVAPGDWYYETASAARAAGIAAQDVNFNPTRPVTRGEFTVVLARAMEAVGWLTIPEEGTAEDLTRLADAAAIPDWALDAYLAFEGDGQGYLGIFTQRETGERDPNDGGLIYENLAQWDQQATRGEVIQFMNEARRQLPWYPTQEAIDWGFDQTMPVVDGSTSTYPYTMAVYGALFSNSNRHPQYPQSHSKSFYSYDRLISGEADLLFASTKPTQDTLDKAAAAGVELEFIPISYDAMVFFTNGDNPATGLTMEQIRNVYVDNAYTNWNQMGGPDAGLVPFCRNRDSGSQAQMEEFFLQGGEIHPDIQEETTSVAMASVLTDVVEAKSDDPLTYGLGYSIYYYYLQTTPMLVGPDALKLLEVEGVYPTDATIADGSYPLAGYNYVVLRADQPEGSLARRMADFMLSRAGQQCVANAGFGPLSNDPRADFEEQNPGWTVADIFRADDFGYMAVAQDENGALRAVYLVQSSGTWGPLTQADCPAAGEGGMTAALLGGRDSTLVFGHIGDGTEATLRLTYEGGSQSQTVYSGAVFGFLLEGSPAIESLELIRDGSVVARLEGADLAA